MLLGVLFAVPKVHWLATGAMCCPPGCMLLGVASMCARDSGVGGSFVSPKHSKMECMFCSFVPPGNSKWNAPPAPQTQEQILHHPHFLLLSFSKEASLPPQCHGWSNLT